MNRIIIMLSLLCAPAVAADPRTYDIGDDLIVCHDGRTPMRIQDGAKMLRKAKDDRSRESLRNALICAALRACDEFDADTMARLKEMNRRTPNTNPFEKRTGAKEGKVIQ